MGKSYPDNGLAQAEAALRDLGRSHHTARHLARRMARHFVAEAPDPELLRVMEKAFLSGDGDVLKMARAMVMHPASWKPERQKLKTPLDLIVSTLRLLLPASRPLRESEKKFLQSQLVRLGQYPYSAPSPAGWSDSAADWLGGEAMLRRLLWAEEAARRLGKSVRDPLRLASGALGSTLGESSHMAIASAPGRTEAVALLIAAPEFQRR